MKKAIFFAVTLLLFGCDQSVETVGQIAETNPYQQGVVLETIDVETYTYMRLNLEGNDVWIASTPLQASEGSIVRFYDSMLMREFRSEVLDRTFDEILFVSNAEVVGAHPVDVSISQVPPAPKANPHATAVPVETATPDQADIQALEGGMTIAEIYAEFDQLEGKQVSLRAQVVKLSPNILGKNWITLRDGTGTAPDDYLVVTSAEMVATGEQVTVTGTLRGNVDIGSGYSYKVLLEDASF